MTKSKYLLYALLIALTLGTGYIKQPAQKWVKYVMPTAPVAGSKQGPSMQRPHPRQFQSTISAAANPATSMPGSVTDRACETPPVKPVVEAQRPSIHRWTDVDGKVNFSDKPPPNTKTAIYQPKIGRQHEFFEIEIIYEGMRSVPFLKDRLRAQVTKMYEMLAVLVGDNRLRQVELNIRLFEYAEDYHAYSETISARLSDAGGFYSLAHNEAVTYQHRNDESTQAVARHEAMHVIAAGLFGQIPTWLNEGLAEYFETLGVEAQNVTIQPQDQWFEMAAQAVEQGYPSKLRNYMDLRGAPWYGTNRDVHYALGWALVHFLMSSNNGRIALAGYLQELADHYCERVDRFAWLERGYPDGYEGFERDFESWLSRRQISAHTH